MVCVQRPGGSTCMAVDPTNNCKTLKCTRGNTCSYQETECIPDKACFAKPTCQRTGPGRKSPGTRPTGVSATSPRELLLNSKFFPV
ncbi:hypothetical protein OESDEN_24363 [Oesophagostomum dentatum]|uniref:Uncharacterized protein n=1 Tax=Oesophagostomum dentatum TaxID=61180 RepID=A0A0B1RSG1_OESDE|nr:hypothetical protein OESDEN_24363 [Oesophagostomum dentatum]